MGFLLRAGFVAAMSLATALPALADSRLFSVKADAPGVTVEQALVLVALHRSAKALGPHDLISYIQGLIHSASTISYIVYDLENENESRQPSGNPSRN